MLPFSYQERFVDDAITAVMVTGKDPSRRALAAAAVRSFQQQTHEHKTLVIMTTDEPLTIQGPGLVQQYTADPHLSLGELRSAALEQVQTPWVIQWDDDDYSHPTRMAWQLHHTQRAGKTASLLRYQLRYSRTLNAAALLQGPLPWKGHPGSMLFRVSCADPTTAFRPLAREEDFYFLLDHWWVDEIAALDNAPGSGYAALQLRLEHGANTWPRHHIFPGRHGEEARRNVWDLAPQLADYLRAVLTREYPTLGPLPTDYYVRGT